MIHIYQADSEQIKKQNKLKNLLENLPQSMHARALRYKFDIDAYNYTLGRLLLKKGLEELGMDSLFNKITFQKNGKPLLKDVYFNISHSANRVVCALSTTGAMGIDIEKEKKIPLSDFNSYFTTKEWADINSAPSPLRQFYWYWTRKESIIKALGVTLSYLHKIELDATQNFFITDGKKWYLKGLDFGKEYTGALCCDVDMEVKMEIFFK